MQQRGGSGMKIMGRGPTNLAEMANWRKSKAGLDRHEDGVKNSKDWVASGAWMTSDELQRRSGCPQTRRQSPDIISVEKMR